MVSDGRQASVKDAGENLPEKVSVIGVQVSAVTMESALAFVHQQLESLRGGYICAANVHTTVMAHEQADYLQVQKEAALILPDGKPLAVVGRRKSSSPMEKTTGTHFMQHIFTDPRFAGKKHFFYGTGEETLEKMILRVRQDYPGLQICGWAPSVFRKLTEEEAAALAEQINAAEADFIWVALGAPRQELLMHRLKGKVCGVMCGVGGGFKILAGMVRDAPVWMQRAGLEWLYRLMQEPRRLLRRYLVTNTKFLYYLFTGK